MQLALRALDACQMQGSRRPMNEVDHYREYFRSLYETHGKLPPQDYSRLIEQQLEGLRTQLEAQGTSKADTERELASARIAADTTRGASALPPDEPSRGGALMAWLQSRLPRPVLYLAGGFILTYLVTLTLFLSEGHPTISVTGLDADAIAIEVEFIAVDLVKETITLTMIPDLSVRTVAARGRLIRDVAVEIDTGSNILTHTFKQGEAPVPWIATVPIEEGDQLDYPFDRHKGDFHIKVMKDATSSAAPNLELDKIMHGFRMRAQAEPTDDRSTLNVAFVVTRSTAVIMLAMLAMISLLLVVFSAVNVAWQVSMNGRKTEFSMMTWIAALLFVVPAVRNGLPGGPPPGALVDVALFFWLHVLTAGSLLSVVWSWTRIKT